MLFLKEDLRLVRPFPQIEVFLSRALPVESAVWFWIVSNFGQTWPVIAFGNRIELFDQSIRLRQRRSNVHKNYFPNCVDRDVGLGLVGGPKML